VAEQIKRNTDNLPDFDEWLANFEMPKVTYVAAFNPETGAIMSVGPDFSIDKKRFPDTVEIDEANAIAILSGEVMISKCFIDTASGELEIVEVKDMITIDDVLHRVIDIKWAGIEKPDIVISRSGNKFKIELSEEFGGTYKLAEQFADLPKRKIFWKGDTVLSFDFCEYNDPHIVYNTKYTTIDEIVAGPIEFEMSVPEDYSIFTRRIFKNYVVQEV